MSTYLRAVWLLGITPLLFAIAHTAATKQDRHIRASPELVGTRYCYGDAEVFSVWLKLRVNYVNRSHGPVILDKEIGKAWYREKVARNLDDLSAGRYEYNPNIDWFFTNEKDLPEKPRSQSPSPDFVVLSPGQRFQSEINSSVVVQYENPKDFAGSVRAGIHVFQVELSAWNHPGEASEFAKSWRKYGELVTGVIKTEPLQIHIVSDPKFEDCK